MKKIWDYFDDRIEYPDDIAENILPYGTVWEYISSTFLNGLINYTEPIAWYVIDRYNSKDNIINNNVFNKNEDFNWYDWEGTKEEYINTIINEKISTYHTDLNSFEDDVVILSKISKNGYMFFYFDRDVSDCCIGRFETDDKENDVIKSVENWLDKEKNNNKEHSVEEYVDNGIINYTKLPLSFLRGWVKF